MPLTKTAKRALRSSNRKRVVNNAIRTKLDVALRIAKKKKTVKSIQDAISTIDRAAKKSIVHKNKAARIKSQLSKLQIKKNIVGKSPKKTKKK